MTDSHNFFCSDYARQQNAPLMATATRGDLWFLLEYTGRWGKKAFEESTIPEKVKAHLSEVDARILMIRKSGTHKRKTLRFFIGQTTPQNPRLYHFELTSYQDILEIDLAEYTGHKSGDPARLRAEPLFLVCSNGKRDQCCARYGTEIYRAMAEIDQEAVWLSSHIGGHNKAPVTLFFPHGVNYGNTTPDTIQPLVKAYQQGQIGLEHYRGRVCFDEPAQAAEHLWREQTGGLDLPGLQVNSTEQQGENLWRVSLSRADGTDPQNFLIERRQSQLEIPMTCSRGKSQKTATYHLVENPG